jgi:hypothetical protein
MTTDPAGDPPVSPIPDPDPELPVFFLSYAHPQDGPAQGAGQDRRRFFRQFFDDLAESVQELVGSPTGVHPGFMDLSIPPGNRWNADLLWAVGSSQCCVALMSEPYVISEWCRAEWLAFAQRIPVRRPPLRPAATRQPFRTSAIIPVRWAPHRDSAVPDWMGEAQRFALTGVKPTIVAEYHQDGIVGLLRRQSDAYETVVWRLAQDISDFYHDYWVETRELSETDLRDAFRKGTP